MVGIGFVYDGTTVTDIAVPGARSIQVEGILEDRTVYGWYRDAIGHTHGFVATPQDAHHAIRAAIVQRPRAGR